MPDGLRFDPDVAYGVQWLVASLQTSGPLGTSNAALVQRFFFWSADSHLVASHASFVDACDGGCPRRVR